MNTLIIIGLNMNMMPMANKSIMKTPMVIGLKEYQLVQRFHHIYKNTFTLKNKRNGSVLYF